MEKKFCKNCEIRIPEPSLIPRLQGINPNLQEFKDGYYCEKCAVIKINKKRTRINEGNDLFGKEIWDK